jgi:hypothetical protein
MTGFYLELEVLLKAAPNENNRERARNNVRAGAI